MVLSSMCSLRAASVPGTRAAAFAGVAALVLLAVHTKQLTSEGATWPTKPFWRIADYLNQFGMDAGDNELSVNFDGGRVAIHDGAAHVYGGYVIMPIDNSKSNGFLKAPAGPNITWPAKAGMQYAVIFTDMGPANGASTPENPTFFPFIHSFWARCTGGSLSTCSMGPEPYTGTPEGYRSPGNTNEVANRYTFLLFEAPMGSEFTLSGLAGAALDERMAELKSLVVNFSGDKTEYFKKVLPLVAVDFGKFGAENPDFKLVRWNYMMVNIPKE